MARRGLRTLFQSPRDAYADRMSAAVAELGWTATRGDDVDAVYSGRDGNGREFVIRALYSDVDETGDFLEWRSGPLRLDELLVAVTNRPDGDRGWLAHVEVPEGLAHDDPDPAKLRDALNARASEGASPQELNEYALQLGAGGATGVVLRFGHDALEVDPGVPGVQVLAATAGVAAIVLTETVRTRLVSLASQARPSFGGATLLAFVGVPFSKVTIATRVTTVDLLQEVAELGSDLQARIARTSAS